MPFRRPALTVAVVALAAGGVALVPLAGALRARRRRGIRAGAREG